MNPEFTFTVLEKPKPAEPLIHSLSSLSLELKSNPKPSTYALTLVRSHPRALLLTHIHALKVRTQYTNSFMRDVINKIISKFKQLIGIGY